MTMTRDEITAEYDQLYTKRPRRWISNERNKVVWQMMKEPMDVLDVGCGNGHTLQYLGSMWPGTGLYGVDLSEVACKLARKRVPKALIDNMFFEDPLLFRKYEAIIMLGTLEHFQKPEDALLIAKDRLALDGELFVLLPNNIPYSPELGESYRRVEIGSCQMEWHFYKETWEAMFETAGFKIKDYRYLDIMKGQWSWVLT